MSGGWKGGSVGSFQRCLPLGFWGCPQLLVIVCRNWPRPSSPALRATVKVKHRGEQKGNVRSSGSMTCSPVALRWAHICLFVLRGSGEPCASCHAAPKGLQGDVGLPVSSLLLRVRKSLKTEILGFLVGHPF